MADTTPEPEYAEDVTELREAQRIIANLRQQIADLQEEAPTKNDLWVYVSDEDLQRLRVLYVARKLTYEQQDDPSMEFEEAFQELVLGAIDVAWDTAREDGAELHITPSA